LIKGSIIVNPWNTEELANAIYEAVTMSDDLRKSNYTKLYRYVTKYTAAYWGSSFVSELRVIINILIYYSLVFLILFIYLFDFHSGLARNLLITCDFQY